MNPIIFDSTPPGERNRLTIFFRIFMVIPHFFTLIVYGIGAFFGVIIAWFALLFTGKYPAGLYSFIAGVARYSTRVNAYMYLLTDAYPPFDLGEHPEYPVRMHIGPPQPQYNRLLVLFRAILYIPVYLITYVLSIVAQLVAIILWFMGVIVARTPEGLYSAQKFSLSYISRGYAYLACLTDQWPPISQDTPSTLGYGGPAPQSGYIPPAPGAGAAGAGAAGAGFAPPAPPPPPPPPAGPSFEKKNNPFGE